MPDRRKGEILRDPGRGTALVESFLHLLKVFLLNDRRVACRHPDAEARVSPDVSAVAEDVPDSDHAPEAALSRAELLFVQAPRDAANAEAILQVEAEDIANDGAFFRRR